MPLRGGSDLPPELVPQCKPLSAPIYKEHEGLWFRCWIKPWQHAIKVTAHRVVTFAGRFRQKRAVFDLDDAPTIGDSTSPMQRAGDAGQIGAGHAEPFRKCFLRQRKLRLSNTIID